MQNLTDEVGRIVRESKVHAGVVHIFNVGSTGAIGTIEFEPGLQQDFPDMLDKLIPPSRDYGHERAWWRSFATELPKEKLPIVTKKLPMALSAGNTGQDGEPLLQSGSCHRCQMLDDLPVRVSGCWAHC
jgi:hypothetical protein